MKKLYYLPAIASILILSIVLSSLSVPVSAANNRAKALPVLEIKTIAEDDEVRKTGIVVFGLFPCFFTPVLRDSFPATAPVGVTVDQNSLQLCNQNQPGPWPKPFQFGEDKLSQHKILVTLNGVRVEITDKDISCQVVEKDKVHPVKFQFGQTKPSQRENVKTVVTDVSNYWKCKFRPGKTGVGVLDIYYLGPQNKDFIADYEIIITVSKKVGSVTVFGTEIQDICALGWSMGNNLRVILKLDPHLEKSDFHFTWDNPLGPFVSCEEAALWQRFWLNFPIQANPN